MNKLITSDNVSWKDGMNFAVVDIRTNSVIKQHKKSDLRDTGKLWLELGDDAYHSECFYLVERVEVKTVVDAVIALKGDLNNGYLGLDDGDFNVAFETGDYLTVSWDSENEVCTIEQFNQCVKELTGDTLEYMAWLTALNDMRECEAEVTTAYCNMDAATLEMLIADATARGCYESEPAPEIKSTYTQAMKDKNISIELGMLYLDLDGVECELIGENNNECVYVGKMTNPKIHPRHVSISNKFECKPIDTRTPEQKQRGKVTADLINALPELTPRLCEQVSLMLQTRGHLAEIKA